MSNDLSDTGSALDEQLVAYLDGELDPESSRRIEALLASDAEVRRRLQSLERTWDLLDELDAAPVGGPFTQSTLEMVAVAAHEDVERDRAEAPGRRRRRALTVGGGLLAAAAAGFLAVVFSAPDPNRRLLEDLPVLENFDEYRQIENIEFLRELRDKKLFSTAVPESPDTAAARVEDLPARRQRVEGMGLDEKEQLLRAEDRFVRLNPEEQQGLRRLDEQLQADPNAQQLRAIMRRYDEWLKSLSSFSRAELAEMKPVERVTRIQKEEQRREGSRRPGGKDMELLLNWMNEYVGRHEKHFLETLSERERRWLTEFSVPARRHANEFLTMWHQWQAGDSGTPAPWMTDEDLSRLRAQLSPETQKRLETQSSAKQWELVAAWIHQVQGTRHSGGGMRGRLPRANDERLAEFFEQLSKDQRDQLLGLPGEEMQRRLQQMYLMRTRPLEGPERRPGSPNRGRWPDGTRPTPKKPDSSSPSVQSK